MEDSLLVEAALFGVGHDSDGGFWRPPVLAACSNHRTNVMTALRHTGKHGELELSIPDRHGQGSLQRREDIRDRTAPPRRIGLYYTMLIGCGEYVVLHKYHALPLPGPDDEHVPDVQAWNQTLKRAVGLHSELDIDLFAEYTPGGIQPERAPRLRAHSRSA
ncbi:hypothetical protein AURDEDRAFT_177902 [Auricularia subglabra TFB-10046 SS5]|uniref:Uncharacterized protein n=1 Tax=Auricularia subglabra (strain TFB-10046 / SS5) TaxID=717982 RepID=J0WMH3_AURST|nr:hypothetical protein AURDEDRAFT_177902 [Auricularia subglabra TFB-10046 SS5]